jgi:hypothetical protein
MNSEEYFIPSVRSHTHALGAQHLSDARSVTASVAQSDRSQPAQQQKQQSTRYAASQRPQSAVQSKGAPTAQSKSQQ